jgi:hypothetical protein
LRRKVVFVGIILLIIGIISIIFSLWQIPFQEQEPYDVPRSSNLLSESFVVPVGDLVRPITLTNGDQIHIYFLCTSGSNRDVDFMLLNETNYLKRKADDPFDTHLLVSRATTYNQDYVIPTDGIWYFVWDNSFSWITQKGVTATITKNWNEIDYRDITVYHTVVPSAYSTYVEYLGIALVVVGIIVSIWGIIAYEYNMQRFDDPDIKETDLGGPDTSERRKPNQK